MKQMEPVQYCVLLVKNVELQLQVTIFVKSLFMFFEGMFLSLLVKLINVMPGGISNMVKLMKNSGIYCWQ